MFAVDHAATALVLARRYPSAAPWAAFLAQSVVQHLGSASGALLASSMLWSLPGGRLGGMARVASLSAVLAAAVPALLWLVERRVRGVERSAGAGAARARQAPAAAPSSQLTR